MTQAFINQPQFSAWPFWVLNLTPEAANSDIDKAARDLTAKLQFGMAEAKSFSSPLGQHQRDEQLIRDARSTLQDPALRLLAEFWYFAADKPSDSPVEDTKTTLTDKDWAMDLGLSLWEE